MNLRTAAAPAVVALIAGLLVAPLPAAADETPAVEQMQEFPTAEFADQAAELPVELVDALARDVDQTPEEYLAQSAAAVVAVEVVDSLKEAGVDVLQSRLDGTELVVNVSTEADAAVVESAGATAELGEPAPLWSPEGLDLELAADVYDGQGWVWSDDYDAGFHLCSVGFTGYLVSTGAPQYATAGHCVDGMTVPARAINQSAANVYTSYGATIGSKVAGTDFFGSGNDVARIAANGSGIVQKPAMLRWGGGTGAPFANSPLTIDGAIQPVVGATLCKSGTRTGFSCGPIVDVDYVATIGAGGPTVNSVVAQLCVLPGDSGGTGVINKKAVGITSWTSANTSNTGINAGSNRCLDSTPVYAGFFQMISPTSAASVKVAYPDWELMAAPQPPTITSISSSGDTDTAINGTVPGAGVDYKVDVYLDGSSTAFATANVNASTGAWSVSTTSVGTGLHTFSAVARYATRSVSTPTTGFIKRGFSIDRIAGANRYATSALVADEFATANTVFISDGTNYPDALSAAPAAKLSGAPLLLTTPTALSAPAADQLERLSPDRVVIVGGEASVSNAVRSSIAALLPGAEIDRIAGANRYATSQAIAQSEFPAGTTANVYLPNGANFPDALSAASAAGSRNAPILLVPGASTSVDSATTSTIVNLGVDDAYVLGSTASVSGGIFSQVNALSGVDAFRLQGPNRYDTSVAINTNAFATASKVYLSLGTNFPDALSGGALAATEGAPLFVTPSNCVPVNTLNAIRSMGATTVVLLGSAASLNSNVEALRPCA